MPDVLLNRLYLVYGCAHIVDYHVLYDLLVFILSRNVFFMVRNSLSLLAPTAEWQRSFSKAELSIIHHRPSSVVRRLSTFHLKA